MTSTEFDVEMREFAIVRAIIIILRDETTLERKWNWAFQDKGHHHEPNNSGDWGKVSNRSSKSWVGFNLSGAIQQSESFSFCCYVLKWSENLDPKRERESGTSEKRKNLND